MIRIRNPSTRGAQGKAWAARTLLVLVVLIPALAVTWLVVEASESKKLAIEKLYEDARTGYLESGRSSMIEMLGRLSREFDRLLRRGSPDQVLAAVRQSDQWDGVILVSGTGSTPAVSDAAILEGEASRAELEFISDLRRSGEEAEAAERLTLWLEHSGSDDIRMDDGRLLMPMLAFLATELNLEEPGRTAARLRFRDLIMQDRIQAAMPPSQLLFLLARLRGWDPQPDVEAAYQMARVNTVWLESVPGETPADAGVRFEQRGTLFGIQSSADGPTVILKLTTLAELLQDTLNLLPTRAGGRLVVEPPFETLTALDADDPTAIRVGIQAPLDGWFVRFQDDSPNTATGQADREVYVLILIGAIVIGLSVALSLALYRVIQNQSRLAQLKNDLVATVSHELKTPVASIRLLVDTLQADRNVDPVRVRDYLGLIARENNRLGHLIENFLSFSRMERNQNNFDLRPVGPAGIAREAESIFRERRPDFEGTLDLKIEDGLPPIQADHDALQTAIGNLLENAWKYGGSPPHIVLAARKVDTVVEFSVTDEGSGISREDQKRIFEKFYQARTRLSEHSGGVGLGLNIVSFIVEKHRGELVLDSTPGRGSVFTIRIPLAGSPMPA